MEVVMEALRFELPNHHSIHLQAHLMNPLCSRIRPTLSLSLSLSYTTSRFKSLLCSASLAVNQAQEVLDVPILETRRSRSAVVRKESSPSDGNGRGRVKDRVRLKFTDAQLKQNWIDALSCPFTVNAGNSGGDVGSSGSDFVIGVDPDVSGALAVLRTDESGITAQVFDSPFVPVLVGKRTRKRLDANSIVQLLRSLDAPVGTTAYIEQSTPFPGDGKQGWWSGGFGYGLWIGVLVASGFSVVPVPSVLWKNGFELSGSRSSKDDSRLLASKLFPSLGSHLKRKKDHGRAEALLIAAYGKGLKVDSDSWCLPDEDR